MAESSSQGTEPLDQNGTLLSSSGSGESDLGEQTPPQEICLLKGLGSGLSGAAVGGFFGIASGVFKKPRSFKSIMGEGGTSAKTFAIMSGVHTAVVCLLRKMRQKDDPLHSGIAGCATGLALGWGGTPQAVLQSCITFGAISYVFELINPPPAAAHTLSQQHGKKSTRARRIQSRGSLQVALPQLSPFPVLPPFTLPWPHPLDLNFVKEMATACRQGQSQLQDRLMGSAGCDASLDGHSFPSLPSLSRRRK